MSQILESLKNSGHLPESGPVEGNPYSLTSDYSFIDFDTIRSASDPNWRGRLKGINAPEVDKFFSPNKVVGGTAGSYSVNTALMDLARKEGYTNVIKTGEYDPTGRELVDLVDNRGRRFEEMLVKAGIREANRYSSPATVRAEVLSEAFGYADLGDNYNKARELIEKAVEEETEYGLGFKKLAINEQQLAYGGEKYFMPGNVMFRDNRRTLNNKAVSPLSEAWDIGWVGAAEGLYGFAEMMGADSFGKAGLRRQRRYLEVHKPEIVTSYKDVDGIFGKEGAFQYLLNNAAISVPYMAATIAGYAAAAPTYGTSILLPVSLYTGTIWNDQSPDNKNAGYAIAGGVTQAVLDRLGLTIILGKGASNMLSKEVRDKMVQAYAKKNNVTLPEASKAVATATRRTLADLAKDSAKFAAQQIAGKELTKKLLKRVSTGAAGEGLTEVAQEAVGYMAAHANTDFRSFDIQEFNTRLIDGMLAGSSMGAAFGGVGSIWDYGMWRDIKYQLSPSTGKQISESGRLAKDDIKKHGKQFNIQENNEKIRTDISKITKDLKFIKKKISSLKATIRLTRDANKARVLKRDLKDKEARRDKLQQALDQVDINDRAEAHEKRLKKRTVQDIRDDFFNWEEGNIPALWRALVKHAVPWRHQTAADNSLEDIKKNPLLKGVIPYIRHLAEANSGNHEKSMTGEHYENRLHHMMAIYNEMLHNVNKTLFAFGRTDTRWSRKKFSEEFYKAFNNAWDKAQKRKGKNKGKINWDKDLEGPLREHLPEFKKFMARLQEVSDDLHEKQSRYNKNLGKIDYFFARSRSFDKTAIAKDRGRFEALLIEHYGYSAEKASEVTTAILNMEGIDNVAENLDGNFSVTSKFKFTPKAHKGREIGIADNTAFKDFLEGDLFTNISNNTKAGVRYIVLEEFVGSDNSIINRVLGQGEQQLINSGMDPEEAREAIDKIAFKMKRYYDAQSGNYKRNHGPIFEWVKKNLIFVTGITSLPFATISNTVELGTSLRGLTVEQIFGNKQTGKDGSLMAIARAFVQELANSINRAFGIAAMKPTKHWREEYGYKRADQLGYMNQETGAAHTTGVSETGHVRQRVLDMYFKLIGLQQWTNAMRAGRAAIAADYITDKITTLLNFEQTKDATWTNEMEEAQEGLRNLGIDPAFMVEYHNNPKMLLDEKNVEKYKRYMREGEFNFVNEAIVLPQTANRPLIFQDPRFALFTQFQGFISTFTAWHLPKMWKDLVKRGTPAMSYSAFATVSSMILLGFASQHLKDLLKYGKTTPYFEGAEYIRRGVGASGILGTGERLIDFAFPMYDKRYPTTAAWAFGTVAGESAALSKALRAGSIGWDVTTGEKPGETMYKISPFSQALYRHFHSDNISWEFDSIPGKMTQQ